MERVDPETKIWHTGSADPSGDQGASSLNGLAHLADVLDKKTVMLGWDRVNSKSAMNVTPHGRGYMRSSLQKSFYMEGQSGEGGTPAVLNPLAIAYHFSPVKSTRDGTEAMVPENSCDVNIGRNQDMSAPTPVEACPLEKRGVPSPARNIPSAITRHCLPTVFEEKGFKSDGTDNIISGGRTAPSFGEKKGGGSMKKNSKLAQSGASPFNFFRKGRKN